ncbi:MAG: glycosyltransferase family 1 protein [Proteobacteria bacterium]|nr:glycosyltransferase family 1 protein [Pseudomonadota bacterium]
MTRILLCLSNSILVNDEFKTACFAEQLITELQRYGNDVLVFNPRLFNKRAFQSENELKEDISEEDLRQNIISFAPELIISFNNANYAKILEITDCPIVIWNADLAYRWNQRELIKNNLERYTFFSFSDFAIKETQELLGFKNNQCHCVKGATALHSRNIPQPINISFIGSCFKTDPALCLLIKKYSGQNDLLKLMAAIAENPFITQKKILELIAENKELQQDVMDISFEQYPNFFSAQKRLQTLLNISDLGLALYGTENWLELSASFPSLTAAFHQEIIYSAQQNEDIYNFSKIAININHCQASQGMPWRVPDIMATNGCLLCDYSPFIADCFKSFVKIPMFTNSFEARDLSQKLLKDNIWRQDLIQASNNVIDAEWRWHHRFKQMEEILNISLLNQNEGKMQMLKPLALPPKPEPIKTEPPKVEIPQPVPTPQAKPIRVNRSCCTLKLQYKIWKHLKKKLKQKGILQ